MIDFKRGVTGDSVGKHYAYFAGNSWAYSNKNQHLSWFPKKKVTYVFLKIKVVASV